MTPFGKTAGIQWGISAMSTANWGGAKLCDVLKSIGLDSDAAIKEGIIHVQFAGGEGMEASIPARKAFSSYGDVLLAYEMNGEDVPAAHGYPVRAVVPGHVGVRSVKWLETITLSHEEAHGPWQRGMAYKGFGPSIQSLDGIDCEKIPSLQEQPVQSMISFPKLGSEVHPGPMTLRGISYSGGGRGIIRVDISIDDGKTWTTAELGEGKEQPIDSAWAWTLWEADIEVPEELVNKGNKNIYLYNYRII
jgi:sulfite oxidase